MDLDIDTYEAQFVIKVLNAFKSKELEVEQKETSIVLKTNYITSEKVIIDLDKIWAKLYFYTKMRIRLEELVNCVKNTDIKIIKKSAYKFLK